MRLLDNEFELPGSTIISIPADNLRAALHSVIPSICAVCGRNPADKCNAAMFHKLEDLLDCGIVWVACLSAYTKLRPAAEITGISKGANHGK